MKTIIVLLHGAADLPHPKLNNLTPLEAAETPNLDFLAKRSRTGIIYPVAPNVAPQSDIAIIALLGYDPYVYFSGRGPLEALGKGINLEGDFLALRTNFATADDDNEIIRRRVGRTLTTKEAKELENSINQQVELPYPFIFKHTVEHRGVLVLKGKFSAQITNVDPGYQREGIFGVAQNPERVYVQRSMPLKQEAQEASIIVNEFVENARQVLKNHPINLERKRNGFPEANILLVRDAGNKLPTLPRKQGWATISPLPLEKGIARLAGIDILPFEYPPCNEKCETYNYFYNNLNLTITNSLKLIKENFENYEYFLINIKETDIPGYDGLPHHRKKMLEIIDKDLVAQLREIPARIVITCNRSTPCIRRKHTYHPVPLLIYDGKSSDSVERFTEHDCRSGEIGAIKGVELMGLLQK